MHALGALTGNQAVQMVQRRPQGASTSRGWQVAARRQPRRRTCIPTRASTRPTACRRSCGASTRRSCAPTRSSTRRARSTRYWFAPIVADAEAGFGGPLNAFELMKGDDRSRRRRRPLRGPARGREEVRPHGRQGARPDRAVHPHAEGRAPGRRRAGRADRPRRAHGRRQRDAAHERHRPSATTSS